MAHQFVFTSLEKTLGGGPGFGIVGISPGFPEALRVRSMGMVSYEGTIGQSHSPQTFPIVNWFGLKIDAGNKTFFVLGRIGPAPKDYSGRRNHIAHLLFLEPAEAASVHPASLLRDFPWMDSWNGPARPLPNPVIPNTTNVEPVSRQWQRLTGDSGYAGAAWDAMENGRAFAFIHDGLDDATLRELVIETLSQAPTSDAWQLRFATLSGDFTEGRQSDLAGAAIGSRQAELWSTQRAPHILLGPTPRILPKVAGARAEATRSGLPVVPFHSPATPSTRPKPATIVASEVVESEPLHLPPQANNPQQARANKRETPPDPMRLLIPGGIGFFLGMLFTGVITALGIYSFWHLRDQARIAEEPGAKEPAAKDALQKIEKPGGAAGEKMEPLPREPIHPKDPEANGKLEMKDPPKVPQIVLPAFLRTPMHMAKTAVGLFGHEPVPSPEMEAQARMIRKLKNISGWSATEKEFLRADRVWELARILQTATPPLPDPFTHEVLDKLTTPGMEDAWVVEASAMIPFAKRNFALAYLSLVANRERIMVRIKKIEERTKGDQNLAPHLQKLKESLDQYQNH